MVRHNVVTLRDVHDSICGVQPARQNTCRVGTRNVTVQRIANVEDAAWVNVHRAKGVLEDNRMRFVRTCIFGGDHIGDVQIVEGDRSLHVFGIRV